MIRILIADDHQIFREGLKQIINDTEEFGVIDEACNSREVLNLVLKNEYDILILDISMPPGRNGLEVLEEIKKKNADLSVLILSMYSEEQYAVQAIKAGASGYLTKKSASHELLDALHTIISDHLYISQEVAEQLASEVKGTNEKKIHNLLSIREFQTFLKIAEGKTLKEIANELAISSSSVSTHRSRALEKMKLKNNADIIRFAIKNKLID
jgi:DNA-binding NarL/FixJ family response regulator